MMIYAGLPCGEEAEWSKGDMPYICRILRYVPLKGKPYGLYQHPLGELRILKVTGELLLYFSKMFNRAVELGSSIKKNACPLEDVKDGMAQDTVTEYNGVKVILREKRERKVVDGMDEAILRAIEYGMRKSDPGVTDVEIQNAFWDNIPLTLWNPEFILTYTGRNEIGVLTADLRGEAHAKICGVNKNLAETHIVQTYRELLKMAGVNLGKVGIVAARK